MTFGQHLEELRTCLFKAVIGIALGVAIGMCFGGSVVEFIKKPLADGLTKYVQNHLLAQTEARLQQLKEEGKAVPEDLAQIQSLVHQDNLLPQESFVDPAELVQQLRQMYPNLLSGAAVPARASDEPLRKDGMLRLFVWHPQQDDPRIRVKTLSAQEAFTVYLKASMLVGMLLASPWVFYQLWSFVGAGLYPHERRYVHVFLPFSLGLFLTGAATAFLFVFEPMLRFLFSFNSATGIDPDPRISEWLGFVLTLPLAFGAAFQLPLVMLFLERIGAVTVRTYWSQWRLAVLVIAIVAMLITPEVYSMILMVTAMVFLYFGGIMLCYMKHSPRRPYEIE